MIGPVDPLADEQAWVDEYRRAARETWGRQRAVAIDEAVRRTASAVRRLMQMQFAPSEPPGSYLGRFRDADGADKQGTGGLDAPPRPPGGPAPDS